MYGIKFVKNIKSESYKLYICSQYICSVKEKDLISNYDDFFEDPMNPSGILVNILNSIERVKKDGFKIDEYTNIKSIRQEVILEVVDLFERVHDENSHNK